MSAPAAADHGASFDLVRVTAELLADARRGREGQAARTLIRTADLRVVVVALAAGATISEHHAAVTASVQPLAGRVRLRLAERSVELAVGELLVLGAGLAHDVSAESDSAFLLTLGWPAAR